MQSYIDTTQMNFARFVLSDSLCTGKFQMHPSRCRTKCFVYRDIFFRRIWSNLMVNVVIVNLRTLKNTKCTRCAHVRSVAYLQAHCNAICNRNNKSLTGAKLSMPINTFYLIVSLILNISFFIDTVYRVCVHPKEIKYF